MVLHSHRWEDLLEVWVRQREVDMVREQRKQRRGGERLVQKERWGAKRDKGTLKDQRWNEMGMEPKKQLGKQEGGDKEGRESEGFN